MSVRVEAANSEAIQRLATCPGGAGFVPVSWGGWFKLASLPASVAVIGYVESCRTEIRILSTGILRLNNLESANSADGSTVLSTDTWYHLGLSRDNTTPGAGANRLFLNGVLETTVTSLHGANSRFWTIGYDINGLNPANLSVAYVRAWEADLSAGEWAAEKNSATAVKASPWGTYALTVHTNLTDGSGNGRDLAANGTLSTDADNPTFTAAATGTAIVHGIQTRIHNVLG